MHSQSSDLVSVSVGGTDERETWAGSSWGLCGCPLRAPVVRWGGLFYPFLVHLHLQSPEAVPSSVPTTRKPAKKTGKNKRARKPTPARLRKLLATEWGLWDGGCQHVAGVDEVGRGPLAGPVVAAAVILPA